MSKDPDKSASSVHSQIIARTAKEVLAPLGIFQKGKSRTWVDDRGWWLVVIEFQPSGFSKGSYLNIGAMWLWHEKDYFSFDVGSRIANFVEYIDEAQFAPEAEKLTGIAKAEALKLRSKFSSIHDAARFLPGQAKRNDNPWTQLAAAIALGYVGKTHRARWLFKSIERKKIVHDWEVRLRETAHGFAEVLDRPEDFKSRVAETIARTRRLLKLPEVSDLRLDDGPVRRPLLSRLLRW